MGDRETLRDPPERVDPPSLRATTSIPPPPSLRSRWSARAIACLLAAALTAIAAAAVVVPKLTGGSVGPRATSAPATSGRGAVAVASAAPARERADQEFVR